MLFLLSKITRGTLKRFFKRPYLSVRWCKTLPCVDSDQCVLLYRDVELEEAWLVHA